MTTISMEPPMDSPALDGAIIPKTLASPSYLQDSIHAISLSDPSTFWTHQASQLHWHKPPSAALDSSTITTDDGASEHTSWSWFPGGEISTCYNCVDRHAATKDGAASPAIFYDSPVTGNKKTITYGMLLDEVAMLAAVLREEGVRKGDVVLVYMPMIPAAIVALLAINRLGAVHAVVFGGFAAPALAQRIEASRPVVVLTASASIDGCKPPIPYRPLVHGALASSTYKPPRVIVWERRDEHPSLAAPGVPWSVDASAGERDWKSLVTDARARGVLGAECVPVRSEDPVYILHTSGTTGRPKGVVRNAGGHAVGLHLSTAYVYGIRGRGDVMFATADIGWVVAHSFGVYGPLLRGAATVLFEGKPVGTPDASAYWRVVAEYGVKTMSTAPTALRAIDRDDGDARCFRAVGERGGLRSLRGLFVAGERTEKPLVKRYQGLVSRYCAPGAQVVDHWWTTELGSPVTARAIFPLAGKLSSLGTAEALPPAVPPMIPGTTGKPMPGFDVRIVDDEGIEVAAGDTGNVVLGLPLAPTAFSTLWGDDGEERFRGGYLARFGGRWLDTGDGGYVDEDGHVVIMGRNDDVLNVSAHRLSSGAIEQAITAHPLVAEAYVVALPDELKGELPFAFIVPATPLPPATTETCTLPPELYAEIQALVRAQVGAIATLGGAVVCGRNTVPRTRSGKTLRRVLRDVLAAERARVMGEGGEGGEGGGEGRVMVVKVPDTIDDAGAVEELKRVARAYFGGGSNGSLKAKL